MSLAPRPFISSVVPVMPRLCSLLLTAFLPLAAYAQDFERVAPKLVPNAKTGQTTLPGSTLPTVDADSRVILKKLRGVVILDRMEEVKLHGVTTTGLKPSAQEITRRPEFAALIAPHLGQPLTMGGLQAIVREVIVHFREHDRPVVDVIVPEQDITTGTVQLVVLEGKVGQVRAEGMKWFSGKYIESAVRAHPGEPIAASALLSDLHWLNLNPFLSVNAVFTPGHEQGGTDIILRTEDRFPLRVYAGYENSGNDVTGENRLFTGFNWGNVFGLGHQLNYQFTTSDDLFGGHSADLRAHSASYIAPLPWRHTLTLFGSYASTEANLDPFDLHGESGQVGLRYTVPLPDLGRNYTHELYAGFDWKRSNDSLEFGFIPVNAQTTDVGQWVVGYRSRLNDSWGAWSFQSELNISTGDWFEHQNDADYQTVRADAKSEYIYARLELSRLTKLPAGFTLSNEFTGQIASTSLLPSEQLSFGGYASVRGYDEHSLYNTDNGWILRNELRTPALTPLAWVGLKKAQDQLQLLAFCDVGYARAHDGEVFLEDGRTVGSETLCSVGPGLRYTINQWLNARVDYGFQLTSAGENKSGRWHIGLTVSF